MSDKTIELIMSNVTNTPVDLVHQVTAHPGTIWENPYNPAKSYIDQSNNYKKYTHYLANALFLKFPAFTAAYKALLHRAIESKKLVFECTCFPGPCHLDALRIMLIKDLTALGYKIKTNQIQAFDRHVREND